VRSPLLIRTPPADERAERAILAALSCDPSGATAACLEHGVSASDLYFHRHRLAWSAAWELIGTTGRAWACDLYDALRSAGHAGEWGGWRELALWLADLVTEDFPAGGFHPAEVVRQLAARRAAIHRANEVLRDAYDGCREPTYYEGRLR
jgi:replicative DNA helicase